MWKSLKKQAREEVENATVRQCVLYQNAMLTGDLELTAGHEAIRKEETVGLSNEHFD